MPLSVEARKQLITNSLVSQTELDDDTLVELARGGDTEALDVLLRRYTSYARSKAKTYFLIGADREDIIQEGMIGLFKAIRDFDPEKTVSFRSFAELCITRQIITAIKGATRQKHSPLNSYVSLHRPLPSDDDDGERQLVDFLAAARIVDPVEQVVAEDEVAQIRAFLADILSDLEVEVLNLYLEGRSYQEIAASLDRQAKSIDNALQRIKRKLEQFLEQRQQETDDSVLHVAPFPVADQATLVRQANGNGHAKNGNGNGNGHHAKKNGNGNGHHVANNGNGNGHHANGNGNGHTEAPGTAGKAEDDHSTRSGDLRASVRFAAAVASRRGAKARKAKQKRASGR